MKIKSISITGVDGAGKTTIISLLENKLGKNNVTIQYMGSRNYESRLAVKYIENRKSGNPIYSVLYVFSFIYEMYYRVWKHRNCTKLVIFDRYVDEKYISLRISRKIGAKLLYYVYYILFSVFFHKTDMTIYLTCPYEVSLARKDDIVTSKDIEKLKRNKELLDEYYNNKNNCITIDTSINSIEETINIICTELNQHNLL